MNKLSIKIIITIIALLILGLALWFSNSWQTLTSGAITIIVIDENDEEIVNDEINFTKNNTLIQLLEENFIIEINGGFLVKFNELEAQNISEAFIKIWINCQESMVGINSVRFEDRDVIHFVYTKIGDYSGPC